MEKEATKPKKKVLTEEEKAARMEAARKYTDTLVDKAAAAESEYAHFTQDQVDKIVAAAALAGSEAALMLAHEAVEETNRGVVEDKDTKNRFATENIYNAIKDEKTVGIIAEDKIKGEVQIAAPLGVLAGIVPTTNPTSTAMFKSLMAFLVLPSFGAKLAMTLTNLSALAIDNAWRTAWSLAFLLIFLVKFSLPVRPKATPPWRQSGLRVEPKRARPVPFCFHGFLPPPRTSPRFKVLACELRELARYAS